MRENLLDLFRHNHEANRRMINGVLSGKVSLRIHELCGHILNAQQIWISRIQDNPTINLLPWDPVSSDEYFTINDTLLTDVIQLIQSESDLSRVVNYRNSKGDSYQNSILEILNHIVLHSAYHRGQVNSLLRSEGFSPPIVDYIFYKREMQDQL
ncbi:MAG: damage-inducible protein DinB [Flavobacterium sp.]|nr:damage-inducible protein DinB [Flavobacterium sp.]